MNRFKKWHNDKYTQISIYVTLTVLITYVLGMLVYYLSQKTGSVFGFIWYVFKPVFFGAVIAHLLGPIVLWFEEKCLKKAKKHQRGYAVLLTYIVMLLAILLVVSALIFTITNSVKQINIDDIKDLIEYFEVNLSSFWKLVQEQLDNLDINISNLTPKASKVVGDVSSFLSTFFIANIFAVNFLLDRKIRMYWKDMYQLFIPEKQRIVIESMFHDFDKVFFGYIRGQSTDVVITGTVISIALMIAGIPYGAVVGLLTGIGNFVPYVGPLLGWFSLIIVCISEGNLVHMIVGLIIMAVFMAIDSNFINPKLLSDQVNIHPLMVIISLLAGGYLAGIVGMILGVPTAAFLKLQFDKLVANKRKIESEKIEAQERKEDSSIEV